MSFTKVVMKSLYSRCCGSSRVYVEEKRVLRPTSYSKWTTGCHVRNIRNLQQNKLYFSINKKLYFIIFFIIRNKPLTVFHQSILENELFRPRASTVINFFFIKTTLKYKYLESRGLNKSVLNFQDLL